MNNAATGTKAPFSAAAMSVDKNRLSSEVCCNLMTISPALLARERADVKPLAAVNGEASRVAWLVVNGADAGAFRLSRHSVSPTRKGKKNGAAGLAAMVAAPTLPAGQFAGLSVNYVN